MVELASYLFRAIALLGLAVAPRALSPDPATPKNVAIALFLPLIALGVLLYGGYLLKKRVESFESRIAAALVWVAVAASILGAIYFSGPRAPLARGAALVGLFAWPALAAVAATLAGAYLGSNFKHKRSAATALVLAGGLFVHGDANRNLGDASFMWKTALDRDPANEAAFQQVATSLIAQSKFEDANKRAAACLRADPTACRCLVTKATLLQRKTAQISPMPSKTDLDKLVSVAAEAAKTCPNMTAARAVHAEALAMAGDLDEANAEADEALTMDDDPARAHAAKAAVLLRQGKNAEAVAEMGKATEPGNAAPGATAGAGGGRDAKLMMVTMAIRNSDLDTAEATLKEMKAANPNDADVTYNLAYVADRRDKYNDARNGYLATLKIDPTYKDARYNLYVLTQRRGIGEESKNHARKFIEMAPDDPRAKQLQQALSAAPAPTAPAPSGSP
ncbi:MAG: hypothetical protein U0441_18425 [Polyangiaceae bacterium]